MQNLFFTSEKQHIRTCRTQKPGP